MILEVLVGASYCGLLWRCFCHKHATRLRWDTRAFASWSSPCWICSIGVKKHPVQYLSWRFWRCCFCGSWCLCLVRLQWRCVLLYPWKEGMQSATVTTLAIGRLIDQNFLHPKKKVIVLPCFVPSFWGSHGLLGILCRSSWCCFWRDRWGPTTKDSEAALVSFLVDVHGYQWPCAYELRAAGTIGFGTSKNLICDD